ncbi:MAG TPA: hypothetical protein VKC89_03515 [Patescibacteria group bacterium]|nr:hypothetical protein [Patescibacteria group bacterium]
MPEAQNSANVPPPPSIQETPKSSSKNILYILGGIIVLVLLAGAYFIMQNSKTTLSQQAITKTILPRSKAPNVITNALTATAIDAQGNAVSPKNTFSTTDKNIYLILTFNNPAVGTKFEYIRYLNDKLLDSNALKILKPNLTNASFVWSLKKPESTHLAGNYRVKLYTNGVFEKEVSYTVK